MAAVHAGDDVRLERVGENIVLTITEDNTKYVLSEKGVHALHAGCHVALDHKCGGAVMDLRGMRKR